MRASREKLKWLFDNGLINLERSPLLDAPPPGPPLADWKRVEGMLLGLAIGDSLGNTTEGMKPSRRRRHHGEIRHYLRDARAQDRRVGLPSDDTQLAFWTLEHLLEQPRLADDGLDPAALAARLCVRKIFGLGRTVHEFIRRYDKEGRRWHEAGPASAGNGALMRIAPMLLPRLRKPSPALWADTALAAMITHNDRASTASCLAFVNLLWHCLRLEQAPKPEWWLNTFLDVLREFEGDKTEHRSRIDGDDYQGPVWRLVEERLRPALAQGLDVDDACEQWYSGAFLLETVPAVLYILARHGHDPEEAIVRAVNDTYDNDTIAAIVGAAVGALHGVDALPARWRTDLLGRTRAADDGRVFELIMLARERFGPAIGE